MATIYPDVPDIFTKIIKQRIADYIDKEVKEMIKTETNRIISEVLADLKMDAQTFEHMDKYERTLVIKAIYNGQDITQKKSDV